MWRKKGAFGIIRNERIGDRGALAGAVMPVGLGAVCDCNSQLTGARVSGTPYPRWFPSRQRPYGMKREYGEEEPRGAKSVTAPATVSGERLSNPLGHRAWEGDKTQRPAKSGDLPSGCNVTRAGCLDGGQIWLTHFPLTTVRRFTCPRFIAEGDMCRILNHKRAAGSARTVSVSGDRGRL